MRNGISVSSLSFGQATVYIVSLTANAAYWPLLSFFRTSILINLYVITVQTVDFLWRKICLCLSEINLVKVCELDVLKGLLWLCVHLLIHHANGCSTCFGGHGASMFGRANSVYNYSTSQILTRYGLTTRFDAYSHRCPVDSRRT